MGFVIGFDLHGELIGTARIVPMGFGLTLTETLIEQLGPDAPAVGEGDWEVGRLVLAPAYRTDVGALGHCLYLSLEYVRSHGRVDRLFAACTHVLSRLYRRFAYHPFARDVPLAGTSKRYTLISGCADEISRTIGPQGGTRTQ